MRGCAAFTAHFLHAARIYRRASGVGARLAEYEAAATATALLLVGATHGLRCRLGDDLGARARCGSGFTWLMIEKLSAATRHL